MTNLPQRIEQAGADQQREMLELAFVAIHGRDPLNVASAGKWQFRQATFYIMLDAEAYVDAALSLIPEGWGKDVADLEGGGSICHVWNDSIEQDFGGHGKTWAFSIAAAALRARAAS